MTSSKRLIVGISGASGIIYAVRLLELLRETDVETHLVVSRAGEITRSHELNIDSKQLHNLANVSYPIGDVGAAISSGSFRTMGMVILPCSMKTLAEVARACYEQGDLEDAVQALVESGCKAGGHLNQRVCATSSAMRWWRPGGCSSC